MLHQTNAKKYCIQVFVKGGICQCSKMSWQAQFSEKTGSRRILASSLKANAYGELFYQGRKCCSGFFHYPPCAEIKKTSKHNLFCFIQYSKGHIFLQVIYLSTNKKDKQAWFLSKMALLPLYPEKAKIK